MKSILVIEDNTELQRLYEEAFTAKGFAVLVAATAQHGLSILQNKIPDLLVLDIMLPGGDNGFDILELMKKDPRLSGVPVVVVTNLDSEEKTAREIGVTDYIIKSKMAFPDIIERIIKFLQ